MTLRERGIKEERINLISLAFQGDLASIQRISFELFPPYKRSLKENFNYLNNMIFSDYYHTILLLLCTNFDKNHRFESGITMLHVAIIYEDRFLFYLLLFHAKVDPTIVDSDLNTSLHFAASYGHYTMVIDLLPTSNINEINDSQETALHLAIREGHLATVKILTSKGASLTIPNSNNQTPLQLAKLLEFTNSRYEEIMKCLKSHLVDFDLIYDFDF